jgi:hypothetical protein
MKQPDSVTDEIYIMMDRAGLDAPTLFDSKRSMAKIVSSIRSALHASIEKQLKTAESKGYKLGKESIKKIEVSNE